MDCIEALKNRRSIKNFADKQISDSDLKTILEAGVNAPSGMGLQSPKILVIQRKDIIERFSKWNYSLFPKEFQEKIGDIDPFYNAPTLLVVLADKNISTHIQDGTLVIGNILNAAYSIGVGACWIDRAKEEFDSLQGKELLKVWNLSQDYVGIGHIALGYPVDNFEFSEKVIKEDYVVYLDDIL